MASVMAQDQGWLKDGIELKFHGMDDAYLLDLLGRSVWRCKISSKKWHRRTDCLCQRWLYQCIYVGMVHHQAIHWKRRTRQRRRSPLCAFYPVVVLLFTPLPSFPLQIGSVPTPWPSWFIAAHPSADRAPTDELSSFLKTLSTYVGRFKSANNRTSTLEFIKDKFGYQTEDIKVRRRYTSALVLILILLASGVVRLRRIPRQLQSDFCGGYHQDF